MDAPEPMPPPGPPTGVRSIPIEGLIPGLLFLVALLVYSNGLAALPGEIFDEHHYVGAARQFSNGVFLDPAQPDPTPVNQVHPPLGKYLIALSMTLWGDNEVGWRMASAIAGASGVAAVFLIGARLFPWPHAGLAAALFLLFEPMYFLHARLGLLDIFATVFTLWAFAWALAPTPRAPLLSGAFLGLALAAKYNAFFLLPVFFLLHYFRSGPAPIARRIRQVLPHALLLPLAVLLLSYVQFFYIWWQRGGPLFAARTFLDLQATAIGWQAAGAVTDPFASPPWEWPLILRPRPYYRLALDDGRLIAVYTVGNPALWWTAFAAAFYLVYRRAAHWIRTQNGRSLMTLARGALEQWRFRPSPQNALLVASALVLGSYLPWFLLRRITLMFYATYIVPFLALLAAGLVAYAWANRPNWRDEVRMYVLAVAALFLLWYPFASGTPMDGDHYAAVRGIVPWMRTAPPP